MQWPKTLMMVAVVAAAAFAGGAFSQWAMARAEACKKVEEAPGVIEAKAFNVVDDNGNVMAVLGADEEGTGLAILDVDGTARAVFGIDEDGSGLVFLDADGTPRVAMGLGKEGPGLIFLDADGKATTPETEK